MTPKLYTLDAVISVGHLGKTVPPTINCPSCGREVSHYQEVELVLDWWPTCNLMTVSTGDYFISEKLLNELKAIEAKGYTCQPVTVSISEDFRRSHPEITEVSDKAFYYFVITGRCDGPWVQNTKGEACLVCAQPVPTLSDFQAWMSEILGDAPRRSKLVFSETWHGEDFFYLSEPGVPLITERVVSILTKISDLEGPLEKQRGHRGLCIGLGSADWVTKT